jgi:hypothetical protein
VHSRYFFLLRDIIPFAVGAMAWAWKKWQTRGNSHWPTTQATVWSYRQDPKTQIIVYTYCIDGQFYSGEFDAPKPWSFKLTGRNPPVEELYPKGTMFPIHYNSENPALSVPISRHGFAAMSMG